MNIKKYSKTNYKINKWLWLINNIYVIHIQIILKNKKMDNKIKINNKKIILLII